MEELLPGGFFRCQVTKAGENNLVLHAMCALARRWPWGPGRPT